MKKLAFVPMLLISALAYVNGYAQQLLYQNFDLFTNGSLSGQGTWATLNSTSIIVNVDNASPITGCFGGGGSYIKPQTFATSTIERVYFPTENWKAAADQAFYLSFLMNISDAGTDDNAHIIGLGNNAGGTNYEFSRIHVRKSGSGFNIGISKGGGVHLGTNSSGINWSTTVYNLNKTYSVVLKYDYFYSGGPNADVIRIWVNPLINNGSEPATSSAAAVVAAGALGNDILFNGDNVYNVYINNRTNGPHYKIDEIRYARGATSAGAWSNLGISGSCSGSLPVVLSNFMAKTDGNYVQLQWQTETETNNDHFDIEGSANGSDFIKIGEVNSKAEDGNSSTLLKYTYSIDKTAAAALLGSSLLAAFCLFGFRGKRKWLIACIIGCGGITIYSCDKNKIDIDVSEHKTYIRIAQVDKDGTKSYSKIVQAVRE